MQATNKRVIQYPPGTGLVLAIFPAGIEVKSLYVTVSTFLLAFAAAAILMARTTRHVALAGIVSCAAIYFMINPTKASYSMAPTMLACAMAGFLTSIDWRSRWPLLLTALCIGLAVTFRVPNLLLSVGYFVWLGLAFARQPSLGTLLDGAAFFVVFLVGMAPTICANWINAGSPFATTDAGEDTAAPTLSLGPLQYYLSDLQGVLMVVVIIWTAWLLLRGSGQTRAAGAIVAINVAASSAFFLTHHLYTQYYLMLVAMLSLWTLASQRCETGTINPRRCRTPSVR